MVDESCEALTSCWGEDGGNSLKEKNKILKELSLKVSKIQLFTSGGVNRLKLEGCVNECNDLPKAYSYFGNRIFYSVSISVNVIFHLFCDLEIVNV